MTAISCAAAVPTPAGSCTEGSHISDRGADFSFVGGAYEAPDLLQDSQRLINWYCEVSQNKTSKMPIALLGTPGLNPTIPTVAGPVRGMWPFPGGQTALVVTGANVYIVQTTAPATQTSIAQFSTNLIATLNTNSGPVVMRDNGVIFGGAGGYVVIVDGTYGYYYRINGSLTSSFVATPTNGSTSLFVGASILPTLYLVGGTSLSGPAIPGGTTIAGFDFNGGNIIMSAAATGSPGPVTISFTIPQFGQIFDSAFLGADHIAFIEGWLIFNQPGTRTFYTNAPIPYTLTFAGAFYALKDSSTDNLVTLFEHNRELWLIGERTTEVWYNAGGVNFAFARLPGIGPQIGCSAKYSICRMGTSLVWLGRNEQGENIVVATSQYSWEKISTHAIEHAIASYPLVNDAIGYAYQEEGHLFYMLTFPTADVTWVFDASTHLWHQRLSFDPNLSIYHRHQSNCYMNFQDLRLVGDYQSGQIHQMSRQFYTDAGNVLRCQRRAPHVWSREDRKRVFQSALQIEFTPGVGLQVGQGSNPQAMLRWSNDGGFSWSNEHWATIGAAGNTINRAMWRRLGRARDRVYELNYSDPTQRDIIGATLFGAAESEEEAA